MQEIDTSVVEEINFDKCEQTHFLLFCRNLRDKFALRHKKDGQTVVVHWRTFRYRNIRKILQHTLGPYREVGKEYKSGVCMVLREARKE